MRTIISMIVIVKLFACISLHAEPWNWAKQAGGVWEDSGEAICTDESGNVYTAGFFSGIAQFGDLSIQTSGGNDIYIAKMDNEGNYLWVKKAGGSSDDRAKGIAVDNDGNVIVVGSYLGNNATFGNFQISGGGLFITKLDSDGEFLWVKTAVGTLNGNAHAVDVDPNGNIIVTGIFNGTVTFGDFTISGHETRHATFITKLNSEGTYLWAKRIDEPEDGWLIARGNSIKADPEGNCYITGYYDGTAVFGSTTLNS